MTNAKHDLPPLEQQFSAEEAGKLLGVSASTVRWLDRTGRLRRCKIGRRVRYPASAIRELLAAGMGR